MSRYSKSPGSRRSSLAGSVIQDGLVIQNRNLHDDIDDDIGEADVTMYYSKHDLELNQNQPNDDAVSISSKTSAIRQGFSSMIKRAPKGNEQNNQVGNGSIQPSYKHKNKLKSVLIQTKKPEVLNVNERYNRNRQYDNAGKYRIGPSFITKSRLAYIDEHKPAKLSIIPDPKSKSLELGLMTYLWTFTDQHDKQEIDLSFLQSLIDTGVDINCKDEHGQTILHAIVRDWHTDVALFAVRNNADVNVQDTFGRSPLHLAAALDYVETAKVLLMNGAKVDLLTKDQNQTPMHFAAKFNSLETMKILIRFQGNITQRDSKDKTVLFLAAESGSKETAQFLLDIGAPVGVYDSDGYSLIAHLLEKIPHVAYRALNQLELTNQSLKQSEVYLSYLESNTKAGKAAAMISKSPIEIITIYDDTDLIMHPVIQKAIAVKWKLFGRNDTIRKLIITLIYLICWLVLAYTFTDKHVREYYKPWTTNGWKIVPESLIVIFAVYFFYNDFSIKKDAVNYHREWMEWRQHAIRSNYVHCHPAWPGDREALESEAERIRGVPSLSGKQKFWFAYEWIMLLVLAAIVTTRVLDMLIDEEGLFVAHKCIFGFGMLLSFVRVLKICIRFRYFSVFLKISGLAVYSFIQVTFLYLQIFVPFVASFWLLFGDDNGLQQFNKTDQITLAKGEIQDPSHLTRLDDILFNVFESSMGQDTIYKYVIADEVAGQTLVSLYHVFGTFILFSILVAFITSKFTTGYRRCVAEASLLQTSIVLQLEKHLSKKDKVKISTYYKRCCNPMTVHADTFIEHHQKSLSSLSRLKLSERRLIGIENVVHEIEENYLKNDRRSQSTLINSIIDNAAILSEKQETFIKGLKTSLKEINQKQDYMNKYLPKLMKPQSS